MTNRCQSCLQFILRGFFLGILLGLLRVSGPKRVEIAEEPGETPSGLEIGNQQPGGTEERGCHKQISWILATVSRSVSSGSRAKRAGRGRDDGRLVCLQSWSQPTTVGRVWLSMLAPSVSVVGVGWEGKQRAAEWQAFGHNPVTLLPPNHATAESGFHTV